LNNSIAIDLSTEIIRGIYWTTLDHATKLVQQGLASKGDFWVFVGYAGWGPGQLQREIDRQSWHIAAAHSSVLIQELITQAKEADTLEAGIGVWEKLMSKIGLKDRVDETRGQFADLALKEWVRVYLSDRRDSVTQVVSSRRILHPAPHHCLSAGRGSGCGCPHLCQLERARNVPWNGAARIRICQFYFRKAVFAQIGADRSRRFARRDSGHRSQPPYEQHGTVPETLGG
jgi:hypothetical protein